MTAASSLKELRDNWLFLLAGAVVLMCQGGIITFSLPFMFKELIEHFHWTREQATGIASVKFLSAAATALIIGNYVERLGFRPMGLLVPAIGTVGMVSFAFIEGLTGYYLAGIAVGFCTGGSIILVKSMLSLVFTRNQGLALGTVMIGFLTGGIIGPLAVSWLMAQPGIGWRLAPALLTIPMWVLAVPVFQIIASPARLARHTPEAPIPGAEGTGLIAEFKSLVRQRAFYPIAIGLFLLGMIDQGFLQHNPLFLEVQLGISKGRAAAMVSSSIAISIVAKLAFGVIYDRFSVKGVAATYLYFAVICLAALRVTDMTTAGIFLAAFALGHGGMTAEGPILAKHVFGLRNVACRIGIFTAILSLGYATGVWFLGTTYDATGSYQFGFGAFLVFSLIAGGILWPVRPRAWLALRDDQREADADPTTA
jgi:MFS family permease